jgi:hypothetical protein
VDIEEGAVGTGVGETPDASGEETHPNAVKRNINAANKVYRFLDHISASLSYFQLRCLCPTVIRNNESFNTMGANREVVQ